MKYAEIICKNFRCKHNKDELCKIENEELPCIMECEDYSDCMNCIADCNEEVTEDGFIIK